MYSRLKHIVVSVAVVFSLSAFADSVWTDYTQLDWIESNGRNYIDTGVKARSGLVVSGSLQLLSADPGQAIFGASDDGANALGLTTRETINSDWNQFRIHTESSIVNFNFTYSSTVGPQKKYTYKFDNGYFTYGSTHPSGNAETATTYESESNIFIAWMGGSGENGGSATYAPAPMLIYSFLIQDKATGSYLRKMYPARRNSDGEVGMLDTENGVFYLHGGSSPFVAGAEKSCVTCGPFMKQGKSATITVSGYNGSTTLSKVPVLVRISTSAISGFSYSDTLANGADVFFSLDQFGVQRLACDIETWNTSGTSLAWVKLPELKGKTTKLYMFWGSGSAATRPPSKEVWSSYVGVWHMNSYDPVTGVTDETGHGWNATNLTGGTATAYNGKFGAALKLSTRMRVNNYDTYVTSSTATNLMPDVITSSCLFLKPDDKAGYDNVLDKYYSADVKVDASTTVQVRYGWLWQINNNVAKINFNYGNGCANVAAAYVPLASFTSLKTAWAYGVSRSDGYNHYFNVYTTTSKNATKNSGANRIYTVAKNYRPVYFGHSAKSTCMDEVRITREFLSDDRIKADYDMVNSASFAVASAAHAAYEAAVEVVGSPQEYGSGSISYGFDYDCTEAQVKTYTVPATVEVSGPGHRAVCDGWVLYSMQADGSMAVERTSESPLAGESDNRCVVTCTGCKKIEWLWHEEYLLTLSSADSTMGTVPESAWYGINTTQTAVPLPEDGYFFYRWTGDTNGMDVFQTAVPMNAPRSLTANFKLIAEAVCEFSCETNTEAEIDFFDPQYWTDGRVPNATASQVTILAPPAGVTNRIAITAPFHIASLDVGAGEGGGRIEITFKTNLSAENSVLGDVHIRSNTYITHALGGYDNAKTTVKYAVKLDVGGDMTIDAGAKINVTGKGHIKGNGPTGKSSTDSAMSAHGGADPFWGGKDAYDSALRPCMYGSAHYSSASSGDYYGGGVVKLSVGGNLVVNGDIRADGTANASGYGGAAGGAVWLTTGTISGSGRISADGGSTVGDSSGCSGCGGRVAIYQMAPAGVDFSSLTGTVSAYGGSCKDKNSMVRQRVPSPAGTVYLQAYGETPTSGGTIIVDNYNVMVNTNPKKAGKYQYGVTPLNAAFDTGDIGNLIVRNCGQVAISNRTVKIHGNLTVESQAKFESYAGTLEFVDAGQPSTIRGTNIYYNVSCTTPGKTLKFGTDTYDNLRIANGATLSLQGTGESPIILTPAVAGEDWLLTIFSTGNSDVSHVTVDHSNASGGNSIIAQASTDAGNNQGWSFPADSEPGDPITWTGASSTTWADSGNWVDKHGGTRLPLETDVVTIPSGCQNYPIVIIDTLFNSLQIASDASLTVNGSVRIDVTNSFTNAGTLNFNGTGKVFFSGTSLDFTGGTVNAARSVFSIIGDGAQTLDFGDCAFKYFYLRKSGGSAAVLGGLSADIIDIYATNTLQLAFAQGVMLAANDIYCRGRAVGNDPAPLVLASATQGETWYVNASRGQYFGAVTVRDCTAAGLPARAGASSVDLGGNVNWTFGVATAEWIGGTGNFDTAANWYPEGVPGSGTDVFVGGISASGAATASGAASMRSLVVGGGAYAASLRVNGLLTVAGDVEVRTNGTLALNSYSTPNSLGNDLIVRNGGKVTHTALGTGVDTLAQGNTANKLVLDVARDVVVESGGAIDVSACGYASSKGPMSPGKWFTYDSNDDGVENAVWTNVSSTCAGHGSARTGAAYGLYRKGVCYGSMFEPSAHGSGGSSYAGGGVIKAIVHRNMTVNGVVSANGGGDNSIVSTYDTVNNKSYTGAGGSVWLDIAGTLSGSGYILARGGGAYDYAGGGGRVAIYYGEDAFAGVVSAESREYSHSLLPGGGTVLKKCKTSRYYDVSINCDEARSATWNNSYNFWTKDDKMNAMSTDIPSADDKSRISLFKDVRLKVGYTSVMNLTQDLKVNDIMTLVNTGSVVRLNYYTLKVISNEHKDGKGWGGSVERCTRRNGEIIWCGAGFAVSIR